MQIRVAGGSNAPFDPAPLNAALPVAFAAGQHEPIVPESVYDTVTGKSNPDMYARIQDTGLITGVTLTAGGTGYTAPTVTINGGGGQGAKATALVATASSLPLNLTKAGSGYTSQPSSPSLIALEPALWDR